MASFVRYRIRFCCDTCGKWDVLTPDELLVERHNSWPEALQVVKQLQRSQIRRASRFTALNN